MKKRHFRLQLNRHAELFWRGIRQHSDIENISIGGALVRADTPVKVGDFISVYLKDDFSPNTLEIGAEVIRTQPSRWGMPAFAVKFDAISEKLRSFMSRLIAKRTSF